MEQHTQINSDLQCIYSVYLMSLYGIYGYKEMILS